MSGPYKCGDIFRYDGDWDRIYLLVRTDVGRINFDSVHDGNRWGTESTPVGDINNITDEELEELCTPVECVNFRRIVKAGELDEFIRRHS